MFKVGDYILNRYRILCEQPKSHHGVVFEAYDSLQNRPVALKALPEIPNRTPQGDRLYRRQIRAISRLEHPNISHLYALEEDELGRQILVLELCHGIDLEEWLRSGQSYHFQQLKSWTEQILQALAYAHSCKIVHRNIAPSYILIDPQTQRLKLLDFGFLSIRGKLERAARGLAEPSLDYLAPEQHLNPSESIPQSDLYAVAAILWRLCCGQMPFEGLSSQDPDHPHIAATLQQFTPLPNLRVPPQLFALLARNLREDPNQRSDSAVSFRREFRACTTLSRVNSEALPLLPSGLSDLEYISRATVSVPNPFESSDNTKSIHQWNMLQTESHVIYGRDNFQNDLWAQVVNCCQMNQPRVLIMRGQPGLGKSRLANWLAQVSSEHGWMTILRSDGSITSLAEPVNNAFFQALGMPVECPEDPFAKLSVVMDAIDPQGNIDRATVIDCLYSNIPRLARHRQILCQVLQALAVHHPLLWVLDSLEHAHAEDVSCIAFLIVRLCQTQTPVTFCLTIDEAPLKMANLGPLMPFLERIPDHIWERSIPPLPSDALIPLLQEVGPLDPMLCRHLAQSCGGNPLYIHHAIAFLSETNKLRQESGVIRMKGDLEPLPPTFTALILARVSLLPYASYLKGLALLGLRISNKLAMVLAERMVIEDPMKLLDEMTRMGFLLDTDDDCYYFAHIAIQDAIQQSLIGSLEGRRLHRLAAELLSTYEPPNDPSMFLELAQHFMFAGDPQVATTLVLRGFSLAKQSGADFHCERILQQALLWLSHVPSSFHRNETELQCRLAQARLALQNDDLMLAEARLRTARTLVDPMEQPIDLQSMQVELSIRMGRLPQAIEVARQLLKTAEASGDIISQAQAHYLLGEAALRMLDPKEARAHLEQAIQLDPRSGDFETPTSSTCTSIMRDDHLVRCRKAYIQAALQAKRDELAMSQCQELLLYVMNGYDDMLLAEIYELCANVYNKCQQTMKAIDMMSKAATCFGALFKRTDEARCVGQLGYFYLHNQSLDEAEVTFMRFAQLSLMLKDSSIAFSHLHAGWLAEMHGDNESAYEYFMRSFEVPYIMQVPEYQGMLNARLARVNELLGVRQTSNRRMRQAFSIDAHHPMNTPHWASLLEEAAQATEAGGEHKLSAKFLHRALHCWLALGLNEQANHCRELLDQFSKRHPKLDRQ